MSRVPFPSFGRVRALGLPLMAGVLFLLGTPPVSAQGVAPLARLDPTSRFIIDLVIDSAVAAGLPTKSLHSKTLEGISRNADNRRIVEVIRKQLGYLRTARASLGQVPDDELIAAAAVIEAGAKPQQLAVFKPRPGRSNLEAFAVWADFLARGVPKDEASSAITKLWQDGADDATFHSLWNNVQSDILQGLNPGAALQARIRESPGRAPASAGKPPEGPQENQSSR